MKRILLSLGTVLVLTGSAYFARGAGFTPIPANAASYNQDPVVEAIAIKTLNEVANATMDGGTNKGGNTWFEQGYMGFRTNGPGTLFTNGLPPAGSFVTNYTLPPTAINTAGDHVFQMPPDYHTNCVIMIGHNNGQQTPLTTPGTLTPTTPASYTAISFLVSAGNGPVTVGYKVHHSSGGDDVGSFIALDWFNASAQATNTFVYNCAGRVSLGGGLQNINAHPAGRLYSADVAVNNPASITGIDFSFVAGSGGNNTNQNGRAVIFAVSGALNNSTGFTNPIPVSGFNYDAVVEADAPQTTGGGVATDGVTNQLTGNLTNNVTVSMDGGTTKAGSAWYEQGYYTNFPNTGIPPAGSTFTSETLPVTYTMPSTYVGNCAWVVASNIPTCNIGLANSTPYGALSFLCALANGDTFLPVTLSFADGSTETNVLFVPDWFDVNLPVSRLVFGRVSPSNRSLNTTLPEFVDPFARPPGPFSFDYRGLTLARPSLYDAVITVTNTSSAVTNVLLTFTNGINNKVISVFAVSGAAVGAVPPVFGVAGTPTPGQPFATNATIAAGPTARASVNGIALIKAWEGSNNIIINVTNVAGSGPISYQWKKAARGQGLHDKRYTVDYNLFSNLADGGRISGSATSTLVISNAAVADSGDYLVVASNAGGSVTSLVSTVMLLTTNPSVFIGNVNQAGGDTLTFFGGPDTGNNEGAIHAIDQFAQKWLSISLNNNVLPCTGPMGFVATAVSGSSVVTSLRFFCANDTQGRDPWDYFLEGSQDGSTFTPITGGQLKGTLSLPTARNNLAGTVPIDPLGQADIEVDFPNATAYKTYRLSITNTIDQYRQSLMQVSEIQFLGTLVPNPPVWTREPDASVTVFVGASPTFGVSASSYPAPKYQWYKNGTTVIAGATGATYTFPNAQLTDSGTTFSCIASNNFGTTNSSTLVLNVINPPGQSYPTAVLADNPNGYWRLDEADNGIGNNGVLAHDYRGGHNGSYSNVTLSVPGYNPSSDPNTAAQFGNVSLDSYVDNIHDVDFARATNTPGAQFSVEAWVFGNVNNTNGIVAKGYNGNLNVGTATGTEQFVLDVSAGLQGTFRFLVRDSTGQGYVVQSSFTPYDTNTLQAVWHHLVGVCDQPNGAIYLYVDGLLAASGTIPSAAGIITQPLPMTIGARKSTGTSDYDQVWIGTIDDVAVYNSVLSPSRVLAHYYAAQRPPVISLQPSSVQTNDNATVTFHSYSYGPGTLTYQWYNSDGFNPSSPIGGQTASNYTFTTSSGLSGTFYQMVVSNPYGNATSAPVQLTVYGGAPNFGAPYSRDLPASATYGVGAVIQLQVVPAGTEPFTYQWSSNGVPMSDNYRMSGTHTSLLVIGYATNTDSATYQCSINSGALMSTADAVTVVNQSSTITPMNAAHNNWSLNTNNPACSMGNNIVTLTVNQGNTASSAFYSNKVSVASFNASFVYQVVTGTGGADGVTFCIQNDPRGAGAVGGGGGQLGYVNITPSAAVALNIYAPNTRGINFLSGGVGAPAGAGGYAPILPVDIGNNADPVQVNLSYGGGVLSATFKDLTTLATITTNRTVDIPTLVGGTAAYVGFTGADGGVNSTQTISNFTMAPPPVRITVQRAGSNLVLTWPATADALLRSTGSLTPPIVWGYDNVDTFRVVNGQATVTIPTTSAMFYRLDVYP